MHCNHSLHDCLCLNLITGLVCRDELLNRQRIVEYLVNTNSSMVAIMFPTGVLGVGGFIKCLYSFFVCTKRSVASNPSCCCLFFKFMNIAKVLIRCQIEHVNDGMFFFFG